MSRSAYQRIIACVLALACVAFTGNAAAFAAADAILLGRVTLADGATPRAGVVVALVDEASEATYRSDPSDERGAFRVDTAPAGTYRVVAEASEGAYLAAKSVAVSPGENRPVSLALAANAQSEPTPGAALPSESTPRWVKWVIVGAVVLGGAAIVDSLSQEEEASPF